VYFLTLSFLVHKIFTFYINVVLNCKFPAPEPKVNNRHMCRKYRVTYFKPSAVCSNHKVSVPFSERRKLTVISIAWRLFQGSCMSTDMPQQFRRQIVLQWWWWRRSTNCTINDRIAMEDSVSVTIWFLHQDLQSKNIKLCKGWSTTCRSRIFEVSASDIKIKLQWYLG
jgi:hypothetical protein